MPQASEFPGNKLDVPVLAKIMQCITINSDLDLNFCSAKIKLNHFSFGTVLYVGGRSVFFAIKRSDNETKFLKNNQLTKQNYNNLSQGLLKDHH